MNQHYIKELKMPKNEEEAREVLGINGELTQEKIKQAYRKLSLVHHPDKNNNSKDLANANIKSVNKANELLVSALENTARKAHDKRAYGKGRNETSGAKHNEKNVKPTIANSFINQNLERARELLKHRGKIKDVLGLFIKNACQDNDWYEFLKEALSEQGNEVDLNRNILIVTDTFQGIECTALYYACTQGNRNVAELLLKYKADVNKVSPRSPCKVPICSALKNNDYSLASLLFQHGAKIDVTPEVERKIIDNSYSEYSKYTKETMEVLLQYTSPEQNTEILKRFSDNNVSTDVNIKIIQLLLSKGANPSCGKPSAIKIAVARGNTQLERLFHDYLERQFTSSQEESKVLPVITQKEDAIQPRCDETSKEATTIPAAKEVNFQPKVVEVLPLNPVAPSDDIRDQLQAEKIEVTQGFVQGADINNNLVAEQPNKTNYLQIGSKNNERTDNRSFQEERSNQQQILTQPNTKSSSQKAAKSQSAYGNKGFWGGMGVGETIACFAEAGVAVCVTAVVTSVLAVSDGIGNFCEKINAERQKDSHMSVGTAFKNVLVSECLKPQLHTHP